MTMTNKIDISMYTRYIWGLDFSSPEDALRHFSNKGVHYADIVDGELEEVPLHRYCSYLAEADMEPGALVTMCNIADFSKSERIKNIATVKGYIDRMEKFGIEVLMLSPMINLAKNPEEFCQLRDIMIESFGKITHYAKSSGITVAIENRSDLTRPDSKTEDVRFILDNVPDLKLVFDTGNFFCVNEDVLSAYQKLSDKIARVHVKDWKTDPFGTFVREYIPRFNGVALGDGEIPLKELIALLKRDEYSGKAVIEIDASQVTSEMLGKSADFLRQELEV